MLSQIFAAITKKGLEKKRKVARFVIKWAIKWGQAPFFVFFGARPHFGKDARF